MNNETSEEKTMKKRVLALLLMLIIACTPASAFAEQAVPGKVILDTDMEYLDDDAIAMFMLSQAERCGEVDLLGVTTVGGNVYTAEATTAALRQQELIGRNDIPVYQGTDVPLAGFRDMEKEARLYGAPDWCGAYWDFDTNWYSDPYARPTDYMNLHDEPEFGYPTIRAMEQSAWDFMIEQVHRYPGEVTIMSIGAATNIAIAIKKDPTFVQDAAGIIYMGGDIDRAGDATAAAELNWFYDPNAIRICLEADWKSQLVVPDDLAREVLMEESIFDRLREAGDNEITKLILSTEDSFDPKISHFVWDVVVPAVYLRPEIMSKVETRYLTADDQPGLNYGRAVSWVQNRHNNPETGEGMPEGVNPVQILFMIDTDLFWDFYVDILTRE